MARILIIEDEIDLNNLIRAELVADGHQVVQAFDGLVGAQYVEEQPFDLVILAKRPVNPLALAMGI
uniref:Response regulatory domain-containing protein n=1 Tax=Thermosporothrix sp. COM3 TaxID=2490863 RepID=A0A455SF60_9CHLR|nr:hypothetical protein KTC_18480 [Thermosporothrix sp. COM3]